MSDLISRSALIENLKECLDEENIQHTLEYFGVYDIIRSQPTVEAKPVEELDIDKKQMLENCLKKMCEYGECDDCEFFEPTDDTDGDFFCAIRDKHEEVPFRVGWDMESAFMRKKVE